MMLSALFTLFVMLNVIDAYLTVLVLRDGGRELNKPLAWLMARFGVIPALALVKAISVSATWFLLPLLAQYGVVVIICSCVFYAAVVAHNYSQIKF